MDKITEEEIIQFLKEETYEEVITSETDIFNECGISGDDSHELIEKYQIKYNVDMSNYLWYFHCDEEGSTFITGMFFKPPYKRVTRIPITPKMLTDFANSKIWKIDYPEHKLPKYRYDIIFNQVLFLVILIWLISSLLRKYF
ncbi:DUF1493 family protein [Flavobacterium alvei]|uniref:DUF1493 family protein n=1 Tax=Flavobacterium alvei TaxID=2080416 RepID=UPI0026EE1C11|nr:DUF1493 family protein [Flavobacterium alvei]